MVEGLTSSATDQGSGLGSGSSLTTHHEIEDLYRRPAGPCDRARAAAEHIQTQEILVTLAERPYPFPSRTRKSSSPAPKILRGQPFGKIGRRQDFCVSGDLRPAARPMTVSGPVSSRKMTTPSMSRRSSARAPVPAKTDGGRSAPSRDRQICPYLIAANGGWRSAAPSREHRCTAVDPPAPLPARQAAALCLVGAHSSCPAYRAARTARALMVAPGVDPDRRGGRRGAASHCPVDRRRARAPLALDRRASVDEVAAYQALLVALMVVAFVVLLVARLIRRRRARPHRRHHRPRRDAVPNRHAPPHTATDANTAAPRVPFRPGPLAPAGAPRRARPPRPTASSPATRSSASLRRSARPSPSSSS